MSIRKRVPKAGVLALLVVALASASLGASVSFAKSSHRVSVTVYAKQRGTSISGTITGSFGRGTQVGKATSSTAVDLTWHVSGGTIHVKADGHLSGGTNATGTWHVVGGTGRFRHISGGGPQVGNIKTLTFHYTGTVNY